MFTGTIDRLDPADLVAMAQCMVIDADAFPYASARFGSTGRSGRTWVARRDGRVEGFLAGGIAGTALRIHGLAVAVGSREEGIGRALLRTAVVDARDVALRDVRLHVWTGNAAAIALYRSEGFALVRRLRGFYPPGAFDGPPDALEMRLALGER